MYNQGYRPPQPDSNGNWYAPPPRQAAGGMQRPAAGRAQSRSRAGAKTQRGSAGGGSSQPPKKRRSLKWQFVKLLLVLILIAGAGAGIYVWKIQSEVKPYLSVFAPNVSVDGIDLSGKTWAEGSELVWSHVSQKQNSWYVRLKNSAGEYQDITAQTLGISFDPSAALEEAWGIGHDVDASNRKDIFRLHEELSVAQTTTNAFFSAQQSADTSEIDRILQSLEAAAYRAPQDAYLVSFNPDDSSNPFTIQPEVWGRRLDTTAIREEILDLVQRLESGEVLISPEAIAPGVTTADIQKTVELRCRAVTPISSSSSTDRTENIRIAFSHINGMTLGSGEKFSFNNTVGARTLENGYLPAVEYAYGSEQWGIGGGVCQASTTVYLAAIQGGMTILKREPHSMAVSYTDLGKDATVNSVRGHEIDFTFRNESAGTVYIAAHVVTGSTKKQLMCEVRLYGPSMEGATYELIAETVQTLPKPEEPIMRDDKDANYVTYVDQTKTIKGRDGYVVDAYLVAYLNGVEMGRTKVSTDTYPARADTVYVGVTPRTAD